MNMRSHKEWLNITPLHYSSYWIEFCQLMQYMIEIWLLQSQQHFHSGMKVIFLKCNSDQDAASSKTLQWHLTPHFWSSNSLSCNIRAFVIMPLHFVPFLVPYCHHSRTFSLSYSWGRSLAKLFAVFETHHTLNAHLAPIRVAWVSWRPQLHLLTSLSEVFYLEVSITQNID